MEKTISFGEISLVPYSDKSFVFVSPKDIGVSFSERLKDAGGKYNSRLDDKKIEEGKGWVFPLKQLEKVKELSKNIKENKVKPKGRGKSLLRLTDEMNEMLKVNEPGIEVIDEIDNVQYVAAFGKVEDVEVIPDESCDLIRQYVNSKYMFVYFSKKLE